MRSFLEYSGKPVDDSNSWVRKSVRPWGKTGIGQRLSNNEWKSKSTVGMMDQEREKLLFSNKKILTSLEV